MNIRKSFLFLLALFLLGAAQGQSVDVLHYDFSVALTDKSDRIDGQTLVHFKTLDKTPLMIIDLQSPKNNKGMQVSSAWLGGSEVPYTQAGDQLKIQFRKPLEKGKEYDLTINYNGVPADGLIISKNKHGERTFFADNWPNRAHQWIPCVDRPNDKASFSFTVSAPSVYKVISNGNLKNVRSMGDISTWTYEETVPSPTKVMVIGAARFAIKTYPVVQGSVPVSAWVYAQDSTKGFYDFAITPAMLKFFSDYIAPFPFESLANVQSKTIFGGMENSSAIFYAERLITGNRTGEEVMAHEIAHQWFGDMASEKSFAHLWLSEGFATYFTNFYYEKFHGMEAMRQRLQNEREEVRGFVKKSNHPVVDTTSNLMSLLNENSYQKGGWVLWMLRREVGDSAFHSIIRRYYATYGGKNADTRDFNRVVNEVTGKDYNWFFDQWLYRGGLPALNMGFDAKAVLLKQPGVVYRLSVPVLLNYADGSSEKVVIPFASKELSYKTKKPLAKATLDPDTELLY